MTTLLLSDKGFDALVERMCAAITAVVPALSSCSITLALGSDPYTPAASDERALAFDLAQYRTDEGPCLDAVRTGTTTVVGDLATDQRWPKFRAELEHRAGCVFVQPLVVDSEPVGALNFHGEEPADLSDEHLRIAKLFRTEAGVIVRTQLDRLKLVETVEQLETAMVSRATIDQAIGIMMASQRCTATEALGLLRNASQRSNVKLRTIAERVVGSVASEG
jgi:GAF domain-containing protein